MAWISRSDTGDARRFASLLAVLAAMLVAVPFVDSAGARLPFSGLVFSALLVTGVYAIGRRRALLWGGLALAGPALVANWASHFWPVPAVALTNFAFTAAFCLYLASIVVREVVASERVTADTLFGGVCGYLLLGVLWVLFFRAAELLVPGSFLVGGEPLAERPGLGSDRDFHLFTYYSFVTLTTLGYGDIVPVTPAARMLATAEAIVGQLYVTIFVAALVGLHLAHTRGERPG